MNNPKKPKPLIRTVAVIAVLGGMICGLTAPVWSADPKAEKASSPAKKKQMTGAELYAIHCNRCHPERYPTEFSASQWKTIMVEMRVRANLPAAQAKAILKYLQEDSGTP